MKWIRDKDGWQTYDGKYAIAWRGGDFVLSRWQLPEGLKVWPPFKDFDQAQQTATQDATP